MKRPSHTTKKVTHVFGGVIILLSVFIIFAAVSAVKETQAQQTDDKVATPAATQGSTIGAVFQATLDTVARLKLDGKVFTDPSFLSLRDIAVEIPEQPVGRDNPFLPIPGRAAAPTPAKAR